MLLERKSESMAKFFVDPKQIQNESIQIQNSQDIIHIKNVLRLGKKDKLWISDGQQMEYECIIEDIEQNEIHVKILNRYRSDSEPAIHVTLFQGLPKSDKLEWIIQKAVELGVHQIVPMITERTVVKISDPQKIKKKWERWNKIGESAAKQSGRGKIPSISLPVSYQEALWLGKELDHAIIPYEKEENETLKHILPVPLQQSIGIFIGPEGGFTFEEIQRAKEQNIVPITLGKRILRTETAGLAVLSIIMYEAGEV